MEVVENGFAASCVNAAIVQAIYQRKGGRCVVYRRKIAGLSFVTQEDPELGLAEAPTE